MLRRHFLHRQGCRVEYDWHEHSCKALHEEDTSLPLPAAPGIRPAASMAHVSSATAGGPCTITCCTLLLLLLPSLLSWPCTGDRDHCIAEAVAGPRTAHKNGPNSYCGTCKPCF
jgi:hypothetical protein